MRVDFTNLGMEPPENSNSGRASQTAGNRGGGSASAMNVAESGSPADRTTFSFSQARVQSLALQALALPEVRQEKVAVLRQAVAEGDYRVDSGKVADALTAEVARRLVG